MHPTHQRFNSNKFGTHANSSKIQKSQVNPSGQGKYSIKSLIKATNSNSLLCARFRRKFCNLLNEHDWISDRARKFIGSNQNWRSQEIFFNGK